jgi:glycosyltransferase involved in cell wall biosynthesis
LESTLSAATGVSGPPLTALRDVGAYGIVAFSHLRWNFVWQRPQQFLSRFAEEHKVLFIEEPDFCLADGEAPITDLLEVAPNITTATIRFPASSRGEAGIGDQMVSFARQAIKSVNSGGEFDLPLLWYYSPMEAKWSLGEFPARAVVYDCMDELSLFAGAPQELVDEERKLMAAADVVFTGGYELWLSKSRQHTNVHFFGCGVEYDHFAKAQAEETEIPADLSSLPRPIIGWFGVIDERVDYDLLRAVAAMRPDWSFALVGPVVKVDPNSLPQAPNLHWLGQRDYKDLPRCCKAFDVCMMCFALNDATKYINPTKALEYLATGRPVVSTAVADVVRQYQDTVAIARTPREFVDAVEEALESGGGEQVQRGIEKASASSWEATVASMREIIAEAIADRETPLGAATA